MVDKFQIFISKAAVILADLPPQAGNKQKINFLNSKFRLGKDGCKIVLEVLKS